MVKDEVKVEGPGSETKQNAIMIGVSQDASETKQPIPRSEAKPNVLKLEAQQSSKFEDNATPDFDEDFDPNDIVSASATHQLQQGKDANEGIDALDTSRIVKNASSSSESSLTLTVVGNGSGVTGTDGKILISRRATTQGSDEDFDPNDVVVPANLNATRAPESSSNTVEVVDMLVDSRGPAIMEAKEEESKAAMLKRESVKPEPKVEAKPSTSLHSMTDGAALILSPKPHSEDIKLPKLKLEDNKPTHPDDADNELETVESMNASASDGTPAPSSSESTQTPLDEFPMDINMEEEVQAIRSPPQKRARMLMDGIELPTAASLGLRIHRSTTPAPVATPAPSEPVGNGPNPVSIKLEPITAEEAIRLVAMENPDIKIKKESCMSDESLLARLHAVGLDRYPISLDDSIKLRTVRREWMSWKYGGSPQGTFPKIKKKITHGMDDFAYLTYEYNPHAPKHPGDPGLFFGGTEDYGSPVRLLVRSRASKWTYMGQYQFHRAVPMTGEEWRSQPAAFRSHWANAIASRDWGWYSRIAVQLRRRLGLEPTEEDIEAGEAAGLDKEPIEPAEIEQDFAHGKEILGVHCLKCIGYDQDFQRELATMPLDWVRPNAKNPKKPKTNNNAKRKLQGNRDKENAKKRRVDYT